MPEAWSENTLEHPAFLRFQSIVNTAPQRIAFVDELGAVFSYQQLAQRAAFLAALIGEGETPVALYLPYNSDMLSAMLACLALGRPYVSLDPDFPIERNLAIIKHAGVTKVLVNHDDHAKVISVVAPILNVVTGLCEKPIVIKATAKSIAYILYTSGTTGKPKGVFQNQAGLLHDVMQYSQAIAITPSDCFSGLYSAAVNGAIRDIYAALFNGATLVRINPKTVGLAGIAHSVAQRQISVFHAIPPLLRSFLNSQPEAGLLRSIRLCYIAGDRLFAADLTSLFALMPNDVEVYNGIGSTECATLYRHWKIDRNTTFTSRVVPVGYAIPERETRLHYHDDTTAEVEVLSPYLAQGYWQEPELTAKAFKTVDGRPGWRSYLTGDLINVVDNDLYRFVGRADNKQKIRGYLIDLALIEAEIRAFNGVTDVALYTDEVHEQTRLIAVLVGDAHCVSSLKAHLASQFASAVMPHQMIWFDSLPRLPNFKVDQKTLKERVLQQLNVSHFTLDSRQNFGLMSVEHALKSILVEDNVEFLPVLVLWLNVLKQPSIASLDKSFSALGGDSLDWLNFIAQLDVMLDKPFPIAAFSVELNVHQVITVLVTAGCKLHQHNAQTQETLIIVPPFVGFAWAKDFAQKISSDMRVVMVPTTAIYHPIGEAQPDLEAVVDALCLYVKTHAGKGNVHFYGVSSGAKPTFFAACRLQAQGMATGAILIGDCAPVGRPEHFASERLQAYSWLTTEIPFYNGTVVEIVATHNNDATVKPTFAYGWWQYCTQVCYLPVLASHVVCLTDPAVIDSINTLAAGHQQTGLVSNGIAPGDLLKMANNALVSGNNLQAICYYEHLFAMKLPLERFYGFNLTLARLRLQSS